MFFCGSHGTAVGHATTARRTFSPILGHIFYRFGLDYCGSPFVVVIVVCLFVCFLFVCLLVADSLALSCCSLFFGLLCSFLLDSHHSRVVHMQ